MTEETTHVAASTTGDQAQVTDHGTAGETTAPGTVAAKVKKSTVPANPTTDEIRQAQVEQLTASGIDQGTAASLASLADFWGAKVSVAKRKPGAVVVSNSKKKPARAAVVVVAEPVAETQPIEDTRSPKQKLFDAIVAGQKVTVTVAKTIAAGVILKFGPVEAWMHFTGAPGSTEAEKFAFIKALKYKQVLQVTVIGKDAKTKKLSVTMVAEAKQEFIKSLKVGQLVSGKVVSNRPDSGARISIGQTTVFMHVSQVEGDSKEIRDANLAVMKRNTPVTAVVIFTDAAAEDVRVSQRLVPLTRFTAGQEVEGTIERFQKGTVVLKLEGGVKGLVPQSRLNGDAEETASITKGGSFKATVVDVDYAGALVVLTRKGKN